MEELLKDLLKYAEQVLGISPIATMAILTFLFAIRKAKKFFDSKIEERSSKIRYVIDELKNIDRNNVYQVEQIFAERYKILMNYKEIMYFLNTSTPSLNINLYQSAPNYFTFTMVESTLTLTSKRSQRNLEYLGYIYGAGYYLFAYLAFYLVGNLPKLYISSLKSFATLYYVVVTALFFAAICVNAQIATGTAIKLKTNIESEKQDVPPA